MSTYIPTSYLNPDGSYVRACSQHGTHPYDWCANREQAPIQREPIIRSGIFELDSCDNVLVIHGLVEQLGGQPTALGLGHDDLIDLCTLLELWRAAQADDHS